MIYIIENEQLKVEIESLGGEVISLYNKEKGKELMWNGDPKYWGRRSPVLFPIVGGLKDGAYFYKGKKYKMSQHGFARDSEFLVERKEPTKLEMYIMDNKATREIYPFSFKFTQEFRLEKNKLYITYKVENKGEEEQLFSLGAHPAFATKRDEEGIEESIVFEKKETASIYEITQEGITGKKLDYLKDERKIILKDDSFKNDALIFEDLDSKKVALVSKSEGEILVMNYSDFKYIAFWNKPGANFVCFEPWNGIGDLVTGGGELSEKPGIVRLERDGIYSVTLGIEVK